MEENLRWDLNTGAAAMLGTFFYHVVWVQRGGSLDHLDYKARKPDVAALQSSLLAMQFERMQKDSQLIIKMQF